jgi:hypothetical protein
MKYTEKQRQTRKKIRKREINCQTICGQNIERKTEKEGMKT